MDHESGQGSTRTAQSRPARQPSCPCLSGLGNSEWTVPIHQGTWAYAVTGREGWSESSVLTFQQAMVSDLWG